MSRIPKSSDTTYVVLKTRFSEKLTQSKSLDTTSVVSKPKIDWFESQPNVVWSPVNTTPNVHNNRSSKKPSGSVKKWVVKLPTCPCVGSSEYQRTEIEFVYYLSILTMAASYPVLSEFQIQLRQRSWFMALSLSHLNFGTINNLTKLDLVDEIIKKFIAQGSLNNKKPKFAELRTDKAMASEHRLFRSSGDVSPTEVNNNTSSADTMNTPSKEDLDNLFGPMFKEYFEKRREEGINFEESFALVARLEAV
ncbi:hypothetical protein Tco_0649885 [Tanacetum coccineum]